MWLTFNHDGRASKAAKDAAVRYPDALRQIEALRFYADRRAAKLRQPSAAEVAAHIANMPIEAASVSLAELVDEHMRIRDAMLNRLMRPICDD